ncbi:MAG: D-alanyl-D-alanine carboxypeptidase [Firmicutes bacterium]|nr:D-alanyl-D-alanine carboxypeptidase [Bacillota bacterium]
MLNILKKLLCQANRVFVFIILACILLLQAVHVAAVNNIPDNTIPLYINGDSNDLKDDGPEIKAPSAILIEAERGQILYKKQADKKLHISTANKIMTAVLVIEKGDLESKVTISKESTASEGSVLFLTVGEKYTVEDLLNAIILTNANDAANALAEYIGGDINKFVEIMNTKAKELNMQNTYFTNPTGLYDSAQYTTANDIGILMKYALGLPTFNRIFSYRAVPWVDKKGTDLLTNSNRLFWEYEGVDGGKTGYIQKELQTAITTATRNDRRLIAIVLDAPENSVLQDSVKLLDYGFNNFKKGVLVSKNQPLTSITIGDKEINLISTSDIYYTYPIGETYVKSFSFNISKNLKPPITKSMIIGIARYTLQDGTIIDVNLYPETEILPPDNFYTTLVKRLKENRDIFILLIFLICIEVLIILYKILKAIVKLIQFFKSRRSL